MNSPEPTDRSQQAAEQALHDYFHKELPRSWPKFAVPPTRGHTRFSNRSRWILVAAAVLLFLGPWLLANKFTSAPKPGAASIIEVGEKTKLAPDR
jgi:hypothetical protein